MSRLLSVLTVLFCALPLAAQPSRVRDAKWMEADGVSVPVPPGEHPRLYLRAHDLGDLKRRTMHPVLKPVWDEMQAAARGNAHLRLEVDALSYLLTRDAELGRRTLAAALDTLTKARFDPKGQDIALSGEAFNMLRAPWNPLKTRRLTNQLRRPQ
jgi:hypothetical protein